MSPLDGLRPPPGAPGAVRDAASCWRRAGEGVAAVADRARVATAALGGSWAGPARSAFAAAVEPFLAALPAAAGDLGRAAAGLEELAGGIDSAQAEYGRRLLAVGLTAAAGVVLTGLTLGGSDEAAALAVPAELAAATELAADAAGAAAALLGQVAEQAVALAARWVVLSGLTVGADAASAAVVYGPGDALRFVHLDDDLELALVGAVAVPIGTELAAATGGSAAPGMAGLAGRLAVGGLSLASADAVLRAALGQGVDPAELAMAALPLGPAGRAGPTRAVPLGFAGETEFREFAHELVAGLREAGHRDVVPVFQGSAVTGVKYTTGAPFDVGRRSDFDIALASPTLFEQARTAGVALRRRPPRTVPLKDVALAQLGLTELARRLSESVDRDVHFMIYPDLAAAVDRSGGIPLP